MSPHRGRTRTLSITGEHRLTVQLHQLDEHFQCEQLLDDAESSLTGEELMRQISPSGSPVEAHILVAMVSDAARLLPVRSR